MYQYPYGNAQQLNLDWLMEQWQEVKQSIDGSLQGEIDRVEAAITDLLAARDAAVAAAGAANTSAGAAAQSAQAAAADAATATAQAAAATQERVNAAQAANNAQSYAGTAQTQAAAAQNAAGQAAASASQAAASASQAAADASDAHDDAVAASGSATNAAASAAGALQNFQLSDAARQAAQAAATLLQPPATTTDIGKALIVKTVGGGTVTAYELGESVVAPAIIQTIEDVPIASFNDGTVNPVHQLIVDIEPVQAGSGVPAPDNVRPITGWTGANIYITADNVVKNAVWIDGTYYANDGSVATSEFTKRCEEYIPAKTGNIIAFSGNSSNGRLLHIHEYNANKEWIRQGYSQSVYSGSFIAGADTEYIRISCPIDIQNFVVMIGTTVSIEFPTETGTVYGGTITNEGEIWKLIVDRVLLNSSDIIAKFNSYNETKNVYMAYDDTKNAVIGAASEINAADAVSNMFSCDLTWNQMSSNNSYPGKLGVYHNSSWNYTRIYIYLPDSSITSRSDAEAWLNANNVQITYRLATPTVYTLPETQVITLLNGINNVWADTGNINLLQYYANSKQYIDEQDTIIKALIAPVLDSMVADTALTANDFRIVDNTLYRITASVAAGAALTPNTNCTATTIGAVLKTLLT